MSAVNFNFAFFMNFELNIPLNQFYRRMFCLFAALIVLIGSIQSSWHTHNPQIKYSQTQKSSPKNSNANPSEDNCILCVVKLNHAVETLNFTFSTIPFYFREYPTKELYSITAYPEFYAASRAPPAFA